MNTTNTTKKMVTTAANGQKLIQPGMITMANAKKYVEEANFTMYRKLGGKLSKNDYRYCAATFIRMTIDIFVGGDPKFFESREAAMGYFQIFMNENGYKENAARIFRSIDLVHAYT